MASSWTPVYFRLEEAMQAFFKRVAAGEKPGFPRVRPRHQFFTLCYPALYVKVMYPRIECGGLRGAFAFLAGPRHEQIQPGEEHAPPIGLRCKRMRPGRCQQARPNASPVRTSAGQ